MSKTNKSKKQKLTKKTHKKIEKEKKLKSKKAETSCSDSDFISDVVDSDSSLVQRIRETADRDVSHRKNFVHGLGWDTTCETLLAAFELYGQIEDCNVVTDRNTRKAKGYWFVLFKTSQGAVRALKQPGRRLITFYEDHRTVFRGKIGDAIQLG